jgi:hypothetical protein
MKFNMLATGGVLLLLFTAACGGRDPGPTQTGSVNIDAGKAEAVRAVIHMDSGEFHLSGGTAKLLSASWRYSEQVGAPVVNYAVTGSHGALSIESPKNAPSRLRNRVNEWTLQMGAQPPLDLEIYFGAGTSDIDVSSLALRSMEVHMGAGEMKLNLDGIYPKDVPVDVEGGAGEAEIRLPKSMGVVVDAKVGIGGVNTNGLEKRDGMYYNDAYAEGKPAMHVNVRGGVGDITLTVGK